LPALSASLSQHPPSASENGHVARNLASETRRLLWLLGGPPDMSLAGDGQETACESAEHSSCMTM
jgi:hypothetical protein